MEYTISILLLPMLTFLVLGLFGMKLRPNTAGYIGSLSLAVTTGLAYITAGLYFSAPRVDGVFARIMPVDFEWLRFTEALHIDLGILLDPISVMMLVVITTVSLMVHIYSMGYMKGERWFSALLRFSILVHLFYVRSGSSSQYFPDVYFLGAGGCFFLPADRILLYKTRSHRSFEKSVYRHPFCRPGLFTGHSVAVVFHQDIQLRIIDFR